MSDQSKTRVWVDILNDPRRPMFFSERVEVASELSRLHAECERLRADAERYRWLRSGAKFRQGAVLPNTGGRSIPKDELRGLMEFSFWCSAEQLDAAIDAERQEQS